MSLLYFLSFPGADDVLLLLVILSLLVIVTLAGHTCRPRGRPVDSTLVTGAVLSLSGLLMGFAFSAVINGYSVRVQSQIREARAVTQAWQYAGLMADAQATQARHILKAYLNDRIQFYREGTGEGLRTWMAQAQANQSRLWALGEDAARHNARGATPAVLAAFSELGGSLLQTQSVWHRRLPDAAWAVLFMFAGCAGFLAGYRQKPGRGAMAMLLLLPLLTGTALFLIAEIDIPGEGIIRVSPEVLEILNDGLPLYEKGHAGEVIS